MNAAALAEELNGLLATEARSLARYLDRSDPHITPETFRAWKRLRDLGHVSDDHVDRLTRLLVERELPVRPASYAAEIANYNYLGLEAVLPPLIEEKRRQIEAYGRAIDHAGNDRGVVQTLAALRAECEQHLRELEGFAVALPVK